jgi:hypothetical protein
MIRSLINQGVIMSLKDVVYLGMEEKVLILTKSKESELTDRMICEFTEISEENFKLKKFDSEEVKKMCMGIKEMANSKVLILSEGENPRYDIIRNLVKHENIKWIYID